MAQTFYFSLSFGCFAPGSITISREIKVRKKVHQVSSKSVFFFLFSAVFAKIIFMCFSGQLLAAPSIWKPDQYHFHYEGFTARLKML